MYEDLILFSRTVQLAVQSAAAYGDTTSMRTSSHVKAQEKAPDEKEVVKQSSLSWNYHKKVSSAGNSPVAHGYLGRKAPQLAVITDWIYK